MVLWMRINPPLRRRLQWSQRLSAGGSDNRARSAHVTISKFLHGSGNEGDRHIVDFEALPDVSQQCDGELSPEMFPKLFETCQDQALAIFVLMKQFAGVQVEAELFEEAKDPF